VIGNNNHVLALTPYIEWVLYIGFAHGVIGLALFALWLGAFIVD
jgi:hypothetical protein